MMIKVQKIHQIHIFISKDGITPAIYNGLHCFFSACIVIAQILMAKQVYYRQIKCMGSNPVTSFTQRQTQLYQWKYIHIAHHCVFGDQDPESVAFVYYNKFTNELTHFLALPKQKNRSLLLATGRLLLIFLQIEFL